MQKSKDYNRKAIYAIVWALEFNRVSDLRKVVNGMFEEERLVNEADQTYDEETGEDISLQELTYQSGFDKGAKQVAEAYHKLFLDLKDEWSSQLRRLMSFSSRAGIQPIEVRQLEKIIDRLERLLKAGPGSADTSRDGVEPSRESDNWFLVT